MDGTRFAVAGRFRLLCERALRRPDRGVAGEMASRVETLSRTPRMEESGRYGHRLVADFRNHGTSRELGNGTSQVLPPFRSRQSDH